MKKLNKILASFRVLAVASAFTLSIGTGLAYASASMDASNDTTGAYSDNENIVEAEMDVDIEVDNVADLNNGVELETNTGDNSIGCNTVIEDIETGDIDVDINFDNELNAGDLVQIVACNDLLDWGEMDFQGNNELTGCNSENINSFEANRHFNLDIRNDSDINNDVRVRANTGYNTIVDNTLVGDIETGDVKISSDIENVANMNAGTGINHLFDGIGDVSADFENYLTGSNSENVNELEANTDVNVDIRNNAEINNDYRIEANTGSNEIGCNTSIGDVKTGDITISITGQNQAN